jgi:hypothetical protein
MPPRLLALALSLSTLACGGASEPPGAGAEPTCSCGGARCGETTCGTSCGTCDGADYCAEGACVALEGDTCDEAGLGATVATAVPRMAGGSLRVRYAVSNIGAEPPFDRLVLELNHGLLWPDGATPGPVSRPLSGAEVAGGAVFLRGQTFCNDVDCGFTWAPVAGSLELAAPGLPDSRLVGALSGLVLKQVRVDAATGELIHFTNARTWCVGDLRLDVPVPALPVAAGACVAEGTGRNLGENIRDMTLVNCDGQAVDLHDRCGHHKATWIIASAGWCGACEAFVPEAASRAKSLADAGLDLIVVLGEDRGGAAPSLAYCREYALAKGLDPANTFIDHDGRSAWSTVFGAINTYTNGSIGLPWNAVLDGRSMRYVWSSNAGEGDLFAAQDALLAAP